MSYRSISPLLAVFMSVSSATAVAHAQTVKADHTTVNSDGVPDSALDAARELRMAFSHASVGGNIWAGLQALADADRSYDFPNWRDNDRGNPGWQEKITEFEAWVDANADDYDVFQNKFCYIDPDAEFEVYRDSMVSLADRHSDKVFVWWTIPLMTDNSDNGRREAFNQQVRDYCAQHDLPLYDIADIESHTVDGEPVSSDGVPAMDPDQSSDGGHLSEVGASRAAHAQWLLMSQIASWDEAESTVDSSSRSAKTPSADDESGCQITSRPGAAGRGAAWVGLAAAVALGLRRRRCPGTRALRYVHSRD